MKRENLEELTEEEREKFVEFKRYVRENKGRAGALIVLLHRAQQMFGYLPQKVQEYIARELNMHLSEVYGVATFYSFFTLFPKGRHTIRVCLGTACYVKGGKKILSRIQKELGIGVKETTPDRRFSVEVNRCMGACALAPVLRVDDDIYGRVSASKIPEILAKYK
ncbi:MAG TPA: NAD(P)H-dependent oxidoreductase subunit E [Candidatus Aerophobetes bacterium]|nr:NAD(P)H-dependent oxidoreductase subunit E [Candidatus Aerophobetes bacterium]